MTPPLIAVAHGSRDPRSAGTIQALLNVVRRQRPDLDVRTSFLDLSAPRLTDVLSAVHGDGYRSAVVVPLLLGRAFHARVDVPSSVAETRKALPMLRVEIADVLGPDQRLEQAAWRRLREAGAPLDDPRLGLILAGAGSSHAPANQLVADVADRWLDRSDWSGASAAFAASADPDIPTAIADLRARGARRFAIGSWFLAPGLLPDRVAALAREHAETPIIAEPMAADRGVAELIVRRYTGALAALRCGAEYSRAL